MCEDPEWSETEFVTEHLRDTTESVKNFVSLLKILEARVALTEKRLVDAIDALHERMAPPEVDRQDNSRDEKSTSTTSVTAIDVRFF